MKRPAMQWYMGDWMKAPDVTALTTPTRAVWFDALNAMRAGDDTGEINGSVERLARMCRCSDAEMRTALVEIKEVGTGDVRECNGIYTVTCRRMKREYKERLAIRRRVQKHRSNTKSPPLKPKCISSSSSSSSISSSSSPPQSPSGGGRREREFSQALEKFK